LQETAELEYFISSKHRNTAAFLEQMASYLLDEHRGEDHDYDFNISML
jgi:hypothetical protein